MTQKVLVGMSGGVDSGVTAMLLKERGFEVVGITFIFDENHEKNKRILSEVKELTKKLNITHVTVDVRIGFKAQIISYFVNSYRSGETPFPCARCNPDIKFSTLFEYAKKLDCAFVSTGHYVNIQEFNHQKYINRGKDKDKDQSFFLWGIGKEYLDQLIFPLGNYHKNEVRELAQRFGFKNLAAKKDSLGICFIEGNDYRKYLEENSIVSKPGNFVDKEGNILGRHRGIVNYTIGQRHGLGLNLNYPVFVSEICLDDNEIVVADFDSLYRKKIILKNYKFVDIQEIKPNRKWDVQVHYRRKLTPCSLNILDDQRAEVGLLKSEAMIAKGQTAVFYDGDRLIGGGFIEDAF